MTGDTVAAAASLDDRIGSFSGMASLVLALITLYTVQRATALTELEGSATATKADGRRGLAIDSALTLATAFIFLAGLPVAVEALGNLHFLRVAGGVRSVFVAVWVLVAVLIVWQVTIVLREKRLLPRLRDAAPG
jgi:thiosulfate reductase cytochrome b subunit